MQYEGLEFLDAVEELARAAGLEVPKTSGKQQPRPDTGLYDMLQRVQSFMLNNLRHHPEAVEYLKGRGLSGEVCRDFDIGYAPAGWDGLIKQLGADEPKTGSVETGRYAQRGQKRSAMTNSVTASCSPSMTAGSCHCIWRAGPVG